jgi:tetratricopeptide (TPR) repeat protein
MVSHTALEKTMECMHSKTIVAIAAGLCLASVPSLALAGEQEASEYYKQALEAYQKGELERALDLLERAYAEDPNLVYQYNRILVFQSLGRHEEALRLLKLYENPMREDEQKRFEDIGQLKQELEQSIAQKEADDGKADAQADKGEMKDPGESPEDPSQTREPPETTNLLGWSLVGVGGALLGGGLLTSSGILIEDRLTRLDCVNEERGSPGACYDDPAFEDYRASDDSRSEASLYGPDDYQRDLEVFRTHRTLSIVFLGGGLLTAGAGVFLLILDKPEGQRADGGATESASFERARLLPYIDREGAGATLMLRF